jgi:hypothetical protein
VGLAAGPPVWHHPGRFGDAWRRGPAASAAAWLAKHPTITTVCRDRSDLSADGIRRGAPEAVQVVGFFHPVQNLSQVLEAFLLDHRLALQAAAVATALALAPSPRVVPVTPRYQGRRRRDMPPGPRPRQRPPSARVRIPYVPYLICRWRESGADSRQLWREIQTLGDTHSARTVGRFSTRRLRAADAGQSPESQRSPYTRP